MTASDYGSFALVPLAVLFFRWVLRIATTRDHATMTPNWLKSELEERCKR